MGLSVTKFYEYIYIHRIIYIYIYKIADFILQTPKIFYINKMYLLTLKEEENKRYAKDEMYKTHQYFFKSHNGLFKDQGIFRDQILNCLRLAS